MHYITFCFIKMSVRIPTSQTCCEDQMAWVIMCLDHCSYLTNTIPIMELHLADIHSVLPSVFFFSLMRIILPFYDNRILFFFSFLGIISLPTLNHAVCLGLNLSPVSALRVDMYLIYTNSTSSSVTLI